MGTSLVCCAATKKSKEEDKPCSGAEKNKEVSTVDTLVYTLVDTLVYTLVDTLVYTLVDTKEAK